MDSDDSEDEHELHLMEDYLSFSIFIYFRTDEQLEEMAKDADTLTEGSLQEALNEIYRQIWRMQGMDVSFKCVVLDACSLAVAMCIFYYYNIEKEEGGVTPERYVDSICRLVLCLIAHLIMQV